MKMVLVYNYNRERIERRRSRMLVPFFFV